jgi:7-cyano-7-deazaguanine synthase
LVELEFRANVLAQLNPEGEDEILQLPILKEVSNTALTSDMEIAMQENRLPSTIVPGNLHCF